MMNKIYKKMLAGTLVFSFFAFSSYAQNWNSVGPNDNNRPSTGIAAYGDVAVSPVNNDVYVTSSNNRYGQTGIDVKKWNGNNWLNVGAFNQTSGGGSAEFNTIAVEPVTGIPFISYVDRSGISNNSISVKKFINGTWEFVGAENFGPGYTTYGHIEFAPNGTLYIAFIAQDGIRKPFVKKWDGTTWLNVGDISATLPVSTSADELKFAISNTGVLYVTYAEIDNNNNNFAIVKKWTGTDWETVGNTQFLGQYRYVHAIAIDNYGVPYITGVNDLPIPYRFAACVKKLNTATNVWDFVGPSQIVDLAYGVYPNEYSDLVIDNTGAPVIAYKESLFGTQTSVRRWNGTTWALEGSSRFTLGSHEFLNIVVDNNGKLITVLSDRSVTANLNDNWLQAYAFNGTDWSLLGNNGVSKYACNSFSIATDASNNIFSVSTNSNTDFAYVKRWNGSLWSDAGAQPINNIPTYYGVSSATDNVGNLFVGGLNRDYLGCQITKYTLATNSWARVGPLNAVTSNFNVYATSLIVDAGGNPIITGQPVPSNQVPEVWRFINNTWVKLGGATGIGGNTNSIPTLLRGKAGAIYISFFSNSPAGYVIKKYDEANNIWNIQNGVIPSTAGLSNAVKVSIDTTGLSDVFYAGYGINYANYRIYKSNNLSSWVQLGATILGVGQYPNGSIAVSNNGSVVLSTTKDEFKIETRKLNTTSNEWEIINNAPISNGLSYKSQLLQMPDGSVSLAYNSPFVYVKKINFGTILPVRDLKLTASKVNNVANLSWNWQDNDDVNKLEVEFSTDGIFFSSIKTVFENVFISNFKAYNHFYTLNGNNYYRIKATTNNGSTYFSNTVILNINIKPVLQILNNPILDEILHLVISTNKKIITTLTIIDTKGVTVLKQNLTINNGVENVNISVQQLVKGVYFIHLNNIDKIEPAKKFEKF